MLSVEKFVDNCWYVCPIIVIKIKDAGVFRDTIDMEKIKEKAVYVGTPSQLLGSDECKYICNMTVDRYGVIDEYLIIEVK